MEGIPWWLIGLAWKIPWTEEPGGLQSMGSQRVGHDGATSLHLKHLLSNLLNNKFKTWLEKFDIEQHPVICNHWSHPGGADFFQKWLFSKKYWLNTMLNYQRYFWGNRDLGGRDSRKKNGDILCWELDIESFELRLSEEMETKKENFFKTQTWFKEQSKKTILRRRGSQIGGKK